jgi:hypothetical protein
MRSCAGERPARVVRPVYAGRRLGAGRGLDQAVTNRHGGGLGAGGDAELGQEVGDVGLGGAGADEEEVADLGVGLARHQQAQHLDLAGR